MSNAEFEQTLKLFQNNQYTAGYNPTQFTAIGWDMSSLDYAAPGIEGWNNRLLGLSSLINPIAWKDTWAGVVRNNSIKNRLANKESSFLEDAGQNILSYTGGILKGTFQGISLPLPVVKGVTLSVASGLDEITDWMTGKKDDDTFFAKVGKSWDLSLIDDWEYEQRAGRGNIGIGDIAAFIIGDVASIFLKNATKDELRSFGAQFMDSDFDIFDPEQKQDIQSHILNVPQQIVNFVGEWVFDLFTVIPGGALVKGARKIGKGLSDNTYDMLQLKKAVNGEKSDYDPMITMLAETDDIVLINNTMKSLGVTDEKITLFNYFLQKAKTKEEVAHIFLAAEYKDKNSLQFLYNNLTSNDKSWGIVLDTLNQGGTYLRLMRSGKYAMLPGLTDDAFKPKYLEALDELIYSVKKADEAGEVLVDVAKFKDEAEALGKEAEKLRDLVTNVGKDKDGYEKFEMVRAAYRDYGLKMSKLNQASLIWKSKLLNEDGFLKTVEYTSNMPGLPTIIRLTRKAAMASYRGKIDLNNTVITNQKGLSKLEEINSITKGNFSASGELKILSERLLTAANKNELAAVLNDIEIAGLKALAKKHNINNPDVLNMFVKRMLETHKVASRNLEEIITFNRKYHDINENTVIVGDLAKGLDEAGSASLDAIDIVGNAFYSMDLKALDNAIARDEWFLKSAIELGIGGMNWLSQGVAFWMKLILFRPARVPRERVANALGILLAGNIYDIFLSKNARAAFYNSIQNTAFKTRRAIDNVKLRNDLTGNIGGVKNDIKLLDIQGESLSKHIDEVKEMIVEVGTKDDFDAIKGFRSADEVTAHLERKAADSEKVIYRIDGEADSPIYSSLEEAEKVAAAKSVAEASAIVVPKPKPVKKTATTKATPTKATESIDDIKNEINRLETAQTSSKPREQILDELEAAEKLDANYQKLYDDLNNPKSANQYTASGKLKYANNPKTPVAVLRILASDLNESVAKAADNALSARYEKTTGSTVFDNSKLDAAKERLAAKELEESKKAEEAIAAKRNEEFNNQIKNEYGEQIEEGYLSIFVKDENNKWVRVNAEDFYANSNTKLFAGKAIVIKPSSWSPSEYKVVSETYVGDVLDLDSMKIPDEILDELNTTDEILKDRFRSGRSLEDSCGLSNAPTAGVYALLAAAGIGSVRWTDDAGKIITENNPLMKADENGVAKSKYIEAKRKEYEKKTVEERLEADWEWNSKENKTKADAEMYQIIQEIRADKADVNPAGAAEFVKKAKEKLARLEAMRTSLYKHRARLGEYVNQPKGNQKPRRSEGKVEYRGQTYDNYGEGIDGKYAEASLHPGETWQQVYGMDRLAASVYNSSGGRKLGSILPGDKMYYNAYAAFLQFYGRNDDVFMMLARGNSKEEIIDWLKNTPEGRAYAAKKKIGKGLDTPAALKNKKAEDIGYAMSYEEWIDIKKNFVDNQLFDSQMKQYFLDGHPLNAEAIQNIFRGRENQLLPIEGSIFSPGVIANNANPINKIFDGWNKIAVENPQQIIENVPMATVYYNDKMKQLIDNNLEKFGGRKLTVSELNALETRARKDAERHVRKWIYNVQVKSNLSEALTYIIPFISAYNYTVKMLMKGVRENPAAVLWLMSGLNKASYDANWVDSEGNPTTLWNASHYVMPIDKNIIKVFKGTAIGKYLEENSEIKLSTRSMNIWFGGEAIPGPGPLVTLPISELVKNNPFFFNKINETTKKYMFLVPGSEGLIDWILPFGASEKPFSYDQLTPQWMSLIADSGLFAKLINSDYRGRMYVDAYSKVLAHKSAQARLLGGEAPLPTAEEVEAEVDALYALKFLSAFVGPSSWAVRSEADIARQEYRKYTKLYGEDADWIFLTERPELISGMVGTNKNTYGLAPDVLTVQNLKRNPEIANLFVNSGEGAKNMLGFFMNTSGDVEYNDYAYKALRTTSAGFGEENYYSKLTPGELSQKSAAAAGWIMFNKVMDAIDAAAIEEDIDPERSMRIQSFKQENLEALKQKYPEWAAEYYDSNPYQYAERIQTIKALLTNSTFHKELSDPSFSQALALFVDARTDLIKELEKRYTNGGARGLTASANEELKLYYNRLIFQLKSESNRFSEFYNRFFERDNFLI
jgi:hypothetical protein